MVRDLCVLVSLVLLYVVVLACAGTWIVCWWVCMLGVQLRNCAFHFNGPYSFNNTHLRAMGGGNIPGVILKNIWTCYCSMYFHLHIP
jgi:hypothetical protein